ncbi:MAG TPA: Rieske (2Fe-2S) protein [Gammaproteobacteria bacterium]|nr:Rieske (2Fe-2S) protein [Gammaproteobacteria bacterium]
MSEQSFPICALADIPEGDSRGFSVQTPSGYQDIFLVRKQGRVFAYMNSCPHTGGPLDWVPDRFLNLDGELIQCATHAALFRIENGDCVAGPCAGQALTAVRVEVRNEEVFLLK